MGTTGVVELIGRAVELYEAGSAHARATKIFGEVKEQTIRLSFTPYTTAAKSHWASNIQCLRRLRSFVGRSRLLMYAATSDRPSAHSQFDELAGRLVAIAQQDLGRLRTRSMTPWR